MNWLVVSRKSVGSFMYLFDFVCTCRFVHSLFIGFCSQKPMVSAKLKAPSQRCWWPIASGRVLWKWCPLRRSVPRLPCLIQHELRDLGVPFLDTNAHVWYENLYITTYIYILYHIYIIVQKHSMHARVCVFHKLQCIVLLSVSSQTTKISWIDNPQQGWYCDAKEPKLSVKLAKFNQVHILTWEKSC